MSHRSSSQLKCYREAMVVWVGGLVGDLGVADIAGEGFADISNAVGDIVGVALCEHLYGAIR